MILTYARYHAYPCRISIINQRYYCVEMLFMWLHTCCILIKLIFGKLDVSRRVLAPICGGD